MFPSSAGALDPAEEREAGSGLQKLLAAVLHSEGLRTLIKQLEGPAPGTNKFWLALDALAQPSS